MATLEAPDIADQQTIRACPAEPAGLEDACPNLKSGNMKQNILSEQEKLRVMHESAAGERARGQPNTQSDCPLG